MIQLRDRLYLTHRRRRAEDYCPLCYVPVKWVYDGIIWIPCDKEPALIYPGKGEKRAVIRRELRSDCSLYADGKIEGDIPVEGLIPHVLTCRELRRSHDH